MEILGAVSAYFAAMPSVLGSVVNLDNPGHYVHWHFINISVANLIVIGLMVVVFVAALLLPFPRHRADEGSDHD